MTFLEWLRSVQIVAVAACLVMSLARIIRVWGDLGRAQRFLFLGMLFLLITCIWDTVLLLIHSDAFSLRLIPLMTAVAFLLVYLAEPSRRYKTRLGQDPLRPKKDNQ